MTKYIVHGGKPLHGEVTISGAKNAALVFSPNFVSYWGGKMEDYYPGDDYADWVGVSLYANKSAPGELDGDMFFASGQYADIVRAAREAGLDIVFDVRPDTDHLFDADPKCEMEEMYLWIEDLLARV